MNGRFLALAILASAAACRSSKTEQRHAAVAHADAAASGTRVLDVRQEMIQTFAADATWVYFVEHTRVGDWWSDDVWRIPQTGGVAEKLLSHRVFLAQLDATGDDLIFGLEPSRHDPSETGGVVRVAKDGKGEVVKLANAGDVHRVAATRDHVYFIDAAGPSDGWSLARVPRGGGRVETLVRGRVRDLAHRGDDVYYTADGALWRLRPGTPAQALLRGPGCCGDLFVDGRGVLVDVGSILVGVQDDGTPHVLGDVNATNATSHVLGEHAVHYASTSNGVYEIGRSGSPMHTICEAGADVAMLAPRMASASSQLFVAMQSAKPPCGVATDDVRSGWWLLALPERPLPAQPPTLVSLQVGYGGPGPLHLLEPYSFFGKAFRDGSLALHVIGTGDAARKARESVVANVGPKARVVSDPAGPFSIVPATADQVELAIAAQELESLLITASKP